MKKLRNKNKKKPHRLNLGSEQEESQRSAYTEAV
jgi:hypothetical protein